MIQESIKAFRCNECKDGFISYDALLTFDSYEKNMLLEKPNLDNIDSIVESQYLVFRCNVCGNKEKLIYKDIYDRLKKEIISNLKINLKTKGFEEGIKYVRPYMIYCGKCDGFDGKGSCPPKIYEDCKLKRLPYGL